MTDLLAHQSHASTPEAFQSHHCKETKGPAARSLRCTSGWVFAESPRTMRVSKIECPKSMGQSSFSDKIATLGVYTIFRQTDDAASFFTLSEFILPMYCYYCLGWRCFPSQAISFNGMAISLCLELHGDWKTPIPKSPRNGGFSVAVVNYLRVHTKYYIYILYIYIHIHTQCLYSAAVVYNHILCIFLIAPTH